MMDGDGRRQTQGGDEQRESIREDEGVIAVPLGSTAGMQNESDSDTVDMIPNANGQTIGGDYRDSEVAMPMAQNVLRQRTADDSDHEEHSVQLEMSDVNVDDIEVNGHGNVSIATIASMA